MRSISKKTNLDNENGLVGKGISYCAVCDAPLYKNKNVAIIGGGNSAFEEGIYLSEYVKELYILNRSDKCRADQVLIDEANTKSNIKIMLNAKVKEIKSENNFVSGIILESGEEIKVDGIFIYIGFEPMTAYLKNLNVLSDDGYVEVDENMRTKVKGVYAAGDAIKKELYQIITAASEGAIAATSAKKDMKNL
jgi:thioredoxin reductase (NADPH)